MKQFLLTLSLVGLLGCTPEAPVQFADGTRTQRSHWQDRWLVINYWAEWCGPCRHEIPELNSLHHNRVENGVVVMGVNWDGVVDKKLNDVVARMAIEFPTLVLDPYLEYGYERAQQLPVTILINPERQVHQTLFGPQTQKSILAAIEVR